MRTGFLGALAIVAVPSSYLLSQERLNTTAIRDREASATVTVLAFDTNGKLLGAPNVSRFESEDQKNIASSFHQGVAEQVPFGRYEIEGYLTGYSSDSTVVAVYQKRVTLVLGLTFGSELPIAPPVLHGRVVGLSGLEAKKSFVRMTSLLAHRSTDSRIGSDGGFDLCGFSDGRYVLMVINDQGVLAARLVAIPYTALSLQINIGENRALGKFTH